MWQKTIEDLDSDFDENDPDLVAQLEAQLGLSGGDDQKPSSSKPSVDFTPPTTAPDPTLAVIKERQKSFEDVISSMKSDSLTDVGNASLRRYERMLASVKAMATKAEHGQSVNTDELPPAPPPYKKSPPVSLAQTYHIFFFLRL